jgi:hypothetical protein
MTYSLNTANSEAACSVRINPLTATARVWFWSGGEYIYRNLSRRSIAKAIATDLLRGHLPSVGAWVNTNCLA